MGMWPKDDGKLGSRFAQEQIVSVLQEHGAGAATATPCRQPGISEQTFYLWKQKYEGHERRIVRTPTSWETSGPRRTSKPAASLDRAVTSSENVTRWRPTPHQQTR
jgi:hypothetical protein